MYASRRAEGDGTAAQVTLIVLGKATHMGPGGEHMLSPRGDAVMKASVASYMMHKESGHKVRVYYTGGAPNFTVAQNAIPILRRSVPGVSQAELFRNIAVSHYGVQEGDTVAIAKGSDLMQNLRNAKRRLDQDGARDITTVEIHVDGYQSGRAAMVAKSTFRGYEYSVRPAYAERGRAMAAFECCCYEPIETVYMFAALRLHDLFEDRRK
jgi:hypothetical protein